MIDCLTEPKVTRRETQVRREPLRFNGITPPQMVALVVPGTGTKLLQSLLDSHEQIYMVPAYPLMYYYPHWTTWERELKSEWCWETLVDIFCRKHASVLDSRKIAGHNGLTTLGANLDQHVEVDEVLFRSLLVEMLQDEPIHRRTFLLALHYAYALCKGEDLTQKRILLYHIHVIDYAMSYLYPDFPDMKLIAMVRDQRPNAERRVVTAWKVDDAKLNQSDALFNRRKPYLDCWSVLLTGLNAMAQIPESRLRVVRHEDLYYDLEGVMRSLSQFLQIDFSPTMLDITFDGKTWWGDKVYDMQPLNRVNPRIVSEDWKKTLNRLDWFVLEGLLLDYMKAYRYRTYLYKDDALWSRIVWRIAALIPSRIERRVFFEYLKPGAHREFIKACVEECRGSVALKDYTWNATYLYKWCYLELQLWRRRWFVAFLHWANRLVQKKPAAMGRTAVFRMSQLTYVFANYVRYWWTILTYPKIIFRRVRLFYLYFGNRLQNRNCLPPLLTHDRLK